MVIHRQAVCGRISITVIDSPSRKAFLRPFTLFRKPDCTFSSFLCYGVVEGVATMMPMRKNVSAVDLPSPCYSAVDPPWPCDGVVKGVAIMMPARKNVSAADNRQKGQNACSMNACT